MTVDSRQSKHAVCRQGRTNKTGYTGKKLRCMLGVTGINYRNL